MAKPKVNPVNPGTTVRYIGLGLGELQYGDIGMVTDVGGVEPALAETIGRVWPDHTVKQMLDVMFMRIGQSRAFWWPVSYLEVVE